MFEYYGHDAKVTWIVDELLFLVYAYFFICTVSLSLLVLFVSDSTHQDVTNTSILVGVGYEPLNSNWALGSSLSLVLIRVVVYCWKRYGTFVVLLLTHLYTANMDTCFVSCLRKQSFFWGGGTLNQYSDEIRFLSNNVPIVQFTAIFDQYVGIWLCGLITIIICRIFITEGSGPWIIKALKFVIEYISYDK